jgi:hypothetical protein
VSIAADPPEQDSPTRVYSRGWSPQFWRGSLNEVIAAGRAVLDELARQNPEGVIEQNVSLSYADGSTQDFGIVDALRGAAPAIDPGEVTGLSISVEEKAWGRPTALAEIDANAQVGIRVKAEGTEPFASGMVATLKSRLSGGADAGERAAKQPMRFVEVLLLAMIPLAFVCALIFEDQQFAYQDTPSAIVLAVLAAFIPAVLAFGAFTLRELDRKPIRFILVPEGEQFPDEGERKTGPVWRAKAWFEKHPLIAIATLLVIGALLGRVADLIEL